MLFYLFCLIALVVRVTSCEDSGGEEEEEESDERENQYFSISKEDLDDVQLEVKPGNKKNSKWLVLDNTFIFTQKDKSVDGAYFNWICRYKRQVNCPFMAHTEVISII